jgi:hypothetical protein
MVEEKNDDSAVEQPTETELKADQTAEITNEHAEKSTADVDVDVSADELDEAIPNKVEKPAKTNKFKRLFGRYWAKKKWTIPVSIVVLLLLILAVPTTRYPILGMFLKKDLQVVVVDDKTKQPVSAAVVTLAGTSAKTDAAGKAKLHVKVGGSTLTIQKSYYKLLTTKAFVGLSSAKAPLRLTVQAIGRQVPIVVLNKVTGKPLANATIKVLSAEAKTDKLGKATLVLPTTATTQKATISLAGFNDLSATVQVTDAVVAANSFSLTAAGKLYFLSNLSGKIDIVKTNLDGTDRQTVLAGTGNEDPQNTSLLASRDWKYLALQAKRSGDNASIYLIDTSTDKLTTIDEGDARFTLVGWANDSLAYYVNRNGYSGWQPKATAIKTYDATNAKLTVAYQTDATGNSQNYSTESLGWVQQVGTKLVWYTTWSGHIQYYSDAYSELNGKQAQLVEYDTTKGTAKTLKTYPINVPTSQYAYTYYGPFTSYQSIVYKPHEIYFLVNSGDANNGNYYNEYEDGKFTENSDEAKTYFEGSQAGYPTYLDSPSATKTFWTDFRDGKNTLFVGDDEGNSGKQIASLSEFSPYGWYSDNYLLLSKNSSELYIMPADGSTAPQKITDYYKPATTYRGYGGGYGGI